MAGAQPHREVNFAVPGPRASGVLTQTVSAPGSLGGPGQLPILLDFT